MSSCGARDDKSYLVAAEDWIKLIDQQQYIEAWNKLDGLVKEKNNLKMSEWISKIKKDRELVGELKERKVGITNLQISNLGTPNESYMYFLLYESKFANSSIGKETLVISNQSGEWKVMSYSVPDMRYLKHRGSGE